MISKHILWISAIALILPGYYFLSTEYLPVNNKGDRIIYSKAYGDIMTGIIDKCLDSNLNITLCDEANNFANDISNNGYHVKFLDEDEFEISAASLGFLFKRNNATWQCFSKNIDHDIKGCEKLQK